MAMEKIKDAVKNFIGRKPTGPKVRYGVVGAGSIAQSAFMPGILQTTNSGRRTLHPFESVGDEFRWFQS